MKTPLDINDALPEAMRRYIANYGWHFTEKACDYAVSKMRRLNTSTGKAEPIEAITREQYDDMLRRSGVIVENDTMADGLYIANMCKADYLKKSVPDEAHMAMFVRDTLDDIDAADGAIMRKWYACMVAAGEPVDWETLL